MPRADAEPRRPAERADRAVEQRLAVVVLVDDDRLPRLLPVEVEEEHHARQDEERLPVGREEGARHPAMRVGGLPEARDVALEPGEVLEVGRRRQEDGVEPGLLDPHGEPLAPGGELVGRQRLVHHGAQPLEQVADGGAGSVESGLVAEEDEGDVGAEQERVELEQDLGGVDRGVELPQLLRPTDCGAEIVHELREHLVEVISDRPVLGVELDRRRDEEAATREHPPLEVTEERIAERVHAGSSFGSLERKPRHLAVVDLAGGLDRGELQLLLRAEVGKDAALAHAHVVGEPTDRQAVEALDRRQLRRRGQDRAAAAFAVGPMPTAVVSESGAPHAILDKLARSVVLSMKYDRSCFLGGFMSDSSHHERQTGLRRRARPNSRPACADGSSRPATPTTTRPGGSGTE